MTTEWSLRAIGPNLAHRAKKRGPQLLLAFVAAAACALSCSPDDAEKRKNGDMPQARVETPQVPSDISPVEPRSIDLLNEQFIAPFTRNLAVSAALGARDRLSNLGMPKNARQTQEGYWIGAQPTPDEIDELYARNIRLIITAAYMKPSVRNSVSAKMNDYQIKHINIPFGGKFPNTKKFYDDIHPFQPEQIYIHCEHGADRSGAILAYLLIIDHGWTIPHALLAVAFPGKNDSTKLIHILKNRGFNVEQRDIDDYLGIYSAENNGGYGGLKVRSQGYIKLIHTTIDAALKDLKRKNRSSNI